VKKKIKEDTERQKTLSCSWIGRINIVQLVRTPKVTYKLTVTYIKIPVTFILHRTINKSKTHKHKRLQIAKVILSKRIRLKVSQYQISNYIIKPQ
jgi:hypothetical protein